MATLQPVPVPIGGLALEDSATPAGAGGDTAPTGPGRFLYVHNSDDAQHTVTLATPGTVSGLAIADVPVVVAAGESALVPLANVFRGPNGRASITYDAVTDVTVAALELPR
ncbi:hypothetical protein [Streptomyces odonnellii]|uniref:hypothetical protein n=1 Tax=Streptomyces odonnellii TaxID=1417980 RepID=UPI000625DAAE|nr:hypothetical protein [Streptomyces odonnellii]